MGRYHLSKLSEYALKRPKISKTGSVSAVIDTFERLHLSMHHRHENEILHALTAKIEIYTMKI